MANNVTFQTANLATAPTATVVETEDQGSGVQRQVVKIGSQATQGYLSSLSVTRTADTVAYTAGDVIGTGTSAGNAILTFASIGPSSGQILITSASLEIDITAVPSGMTSFRLYLYNASMSGGSNYADNNAWDLPSGDRSSFLGYVDLGTPVDLGSTLYVEVNGVNKQVLLSGTSLYGYLVTNGGYTPASGSVFVIKLYAQAV